MQDCCAAEFVRRCKLQLWAWASILQCGGLALRRYTCMLAGKHGDSEFFRACCEKLPYLPYYNPTWHEYEFRRCAHFRQSHAHPLPGVPGTSTEAELVSSYWRLGQGPKRGSVFCTNRNNYKHLMFLGPKITPEFHITPQNRRPVFLWTTAPRNCEGGKNC